MNEVAFLKKFSLLTKLKFTVTFLLLYPIFLLYPILLL